MIGPEGGKSNPTNACKRAEASRRNSRDQPRAPEPSFRCFGGVLPELRSALNLIWEVKLEQTSGLVAILRERFFSFGMVLSIGFLLLVSLVVSTVLAAAGNFFGGLLPIPSPVLGVLNFLVSYIGVAVLFGLIFKFVPEGKVRWRDVWPGALVTAVFFTVGKTLIRLYLGGNRVSDLPYGPPVP